MRASLKNDGERHQHLSYAERRPSSNFTRGRRAPGWGAENPPSAVAADACPLYRSVVRF